jgi:hypothetical protein
VDDHGTSAFITQRTKRGEERIALGRGCLRE